MPDAAPLQLHVVQVGDRIVFMPPPMSSDPEALTDIAQQLAVVLDDDAIRIRVPEPGDERDALRLDLSAEQPGVWHLEIAGGGGDPGGEGAFDLVVHGGVVKIDGAASPAKTALLTFDLPVEVGHVPSGGDLTTVRVDLGGGGVGVVPDIGFIGGAGFGPAASVTSTATPPSFLQEQPEPTLDVGLIGAVGLGPQAALTMTATVPEFGLLAQPDFPETDVAFGAPMSVTYTATTIGEGIGIAPPAGDVGRTPVWRRPLVLLGAGAVTAGVVIGAIVLSGGGSKEPAIPDAWRTPDGLVAATGAPPHVDGTGDFVYSVPNVTPGDSAPNVDIRSAQVGALDLTDDQAAALNEQFACGPTVLCGDAEALMAAGRVIIGQLELGAALPSGTGDTRQYRYDLVFDSDGMTANNFRFTPPFSWDYFQGTDRWYHAVWRNGDWLIEASQNTDANKPEPSPTAVRGILDGSTITFVIPGEEVPAADAGWRASSFRHDGSFLPPKSGGDVTGTDPTQPLLVLGR